MSQRYCLEMPRSAANWVLVFSPWIFFINSRSSWTVSALYAITAYTVRQSSVHVKTLFFLAGQSDSDSGHSRTKESGLVCPQEARKADMTGTDEGFLVLLLAMAVILYVNWLRIEWRQ